jgi:hypothetical protein
VSWGSRVDLRGIRYIVPLKSCLTSCSAWTARLVIFHLGLAFQDSFTPPQDHRRSLLPLFGHAVVEDMRMESLVIELSSQRMYRDLFWYLARIAPLLAPVFLVLLAMPRYRRGAALGLLICAVGAIVLAVVFHYTYATTTWAGHDSAIRFLDQSAFLAGFGASVVAYGAWLVVCAAARRIALWRS